jgi:hypothetical protein
MMFTHVKQIWHENTPMMFTHAKQAAGPTWFPFGILSLAGSLAGRMS